MVKLEHVQLRFVGSHQYRLRAREIEPGVSAVALLLAQVHYSLRKFNLNGN